MYFINIMLDLHELKILVPYTLNKMNYYSYFKVTIYQAIQPSLSDVYLY